MADEPLASTTLRAIAPATPRCNISTQRTPADEAPDSAVEVRPPPRAESSASPTPAAILVRPSSRDSGSCEHKITPPIAITRPTACNALGWSPLAKPTATGIATPVAAIGAAIDIAPTVIAA